MRNRPSRYFASFLSAGLLFSSLCPSSASDQAPTVKDIFSNIGRDQAAIATSPGRIDKTDFMVWGTVGISMLVLMPNYNDRLSIGERTAGGIERENGQYDRLFDRMTYLGDGRVLFSASLVSYGAAAMTDSYGLQRFSARWIEALTNTTLWVTGLKMLAGRNRPENRRPQSRFTGPQGYFKRQGTNSSFPSGHTALAFASATVLTRESDNNLWVAIPAYAVAGGVGFSRLYVEKHWLTDILFGAALGHSIGMLVENRRGRSKQTAWRMEPMFLEDGAGLRWVRRW